MHRRFVIDPTYQFVPHKPTRLKSLIPLPENPRVSVVMSSFNQGGFIEETIDSILDQDYENIELIVMDGMSTDGTQAIVEDCIRRASRVRLISEEDDNPLEALHKGLRLATGHILAMQNSSDFYYPGVFTQVVDEFRRNPKLFAVGGNCPEIEADGSPREAMTGDGFYEQRTRLTVDDVLMWRQPPIQTGFFRREVLFSYGGFDERFNTCHSAFFLHFLLEGFRMGGEVWMVPEHWGVFRRHELSNHALVQSNTRDVWVEQYWSCGYAMEVFADFLSDTQMKCLETRRQVIVTEDSKDFMEQICQLIKARRVPEALDYYDSYRALLTADSQEVQQFDAVIEKVRRVSQVG